MIKKSKTRTNPSTPSRRKNLVRGSARTKDLEMKWITALYPESAHEVADWVLYAQSWFKVKRPDYHSIKALCAFVENYLLNTLRPLGIPITPAGFLGAAAGRGLSSAIALPSFRDMLARTAPISARSTNNLIHRFINHVLQTEYNATSNPDGSLTTEDGVNLQKSR